MGQRGGKRVGSGRPRKHNLTVVSPGKAASVVAPPVPDGLTVERPGLSPEAVVIWDALAPHAIREVTLTVGSRLDFAAFCEAVVEHERGRAALAMMRAGEDDWRKQQRVCLSSGAALKEWRRAYRLAPNGLPMVAPEAKAEKPKSALEKLKERRQSMQVVR